MRIDFERTGGFAGPAADLRGTVDTNTLPPQEVEELEALVRAADLTALEQSLSGPPAMPDAFDYVLHIEFEPGRQQRIELNETAVPPNLRPLLRWLVSRGTKYRKGE